MLFYRLAICLFIFGVAQAKPGLKQGGAACLPQPNYCKNGGTCYTQYTQRPVPVVTTTPYVPPATTACIVPTRPATVPTTTACVVPTRPVTVPTQPPTVPTTTACVVPTRPVTVPTQPPTVPTTTACIVPERTTTTTPVPTTTEYVWVTEPVCGCQPQFVGDRCEEPVTEAPATSAPVTYAPVTEPPVTQPACIPPTEKPVSACDAVQCQNGGTCTEIDIAPFAICTCPPEYTGANCEVLVTVEPETTPETTANPYGVVTDATQEAVTHIPHCNFTIRLLNDGAYTARMRVIYKIDGVQQPIYTSPDLPIIGNTAQVTIPWYATDLVVSLERYTGSNWAGIVQDYGINSVNWCTKCYKVWGVVTNPNWDYLSC